jgi:hypothetical protein
VLPRSCKCHLLLHPQLVPRYQLLQRRVNVQLLLSLPLAGTNGVHRKPNWRQAVANQGNAGTPRMESYLHVVRKSKTGLVVPDAALQASTLHANVPSDTTTTRHGTESSSGKELPSTARHNRVATNLPIGFGCFVLGSGPNTGSFGVATPLPGRGAGGSVVADSRPFIDRCPARQPHAHDGSTVKADTHTQ